MTRSQMLFGVLWWAIVWGGLGLWVAYAYRRQRTTDDEDEIAKRSTRRM